MGDCNGIGPEISLKAVASPTVQRRCIPVLVGSMDVFEFYGRLLGKKLLLRELDRSVAFRGGQSRVAYVLNTRKFEKPRIAPGKLSVDAGRFAGEAIEAAANLCLTNEADALVTSPVSKKSLQIAGYKFPGQTELIAKLCSVSTAQMMLVANPLRVALATIHHPLKDVHRAITRKNIHRVLAAVHASLVRDFGIRNPRIAVLGLNPHAGENGVLGIEEHREIIPAVRQARSKRMRVEGPFPADGFFGTRSYEQYDAVVAMYHDQGLVPMKLLSFWKGVNFSAGLPIVRTSPDHGTAFDIAGKGIANPSSMIEAIKLAVSIVHNRRRRKR